jgi:hypothetical protein
MWIYSSFLIRCRLTLDEDDQERAVYEVEHIQTGNRHRTATLPDLCEWMAVASRTRKSADPTAETDSSAKE